MIQKRKLTSPLTALLNYNAEQHLRPSASSGILQNFLGAMKRNFDSANSSLASSKEGSPVRQGGIVGVEEWGSSSKLTKEEVVDLTNEDIVDLTIEEKLAESVSLKTRVLGTASGPIADYAASTSAFWSTPVERNNERTPAVTHGQLSFAAAAQQLRALSTTPWQVLPMQNGPGNFSSTRNSPLPFTSFSTPGSYVSPQSFNPCFSQFPPLTPNPVGLTSHSSSTAPGLVSFRSFHSSQAAIIAKSNSSLQNLQFDALDPRSPSEDVTKKGPFAETKREKIISGQRQEFFTTKVKENVQSAQRQEVYSTKENVQLIRTDSLDSAVVVSEGKPSAIATQLEEGEMVQDNVNEDDVNSLDDYLEENYKSKMEGMPRQWEWTSYGELYRKRLNEQKKHLHKYYYGYRQPMEFTVMTYNILSQDLLETHDHLYKGGRSRSLEWKDRRRRLVAEIAYHNSDIINLQEVHRDHFNEYLKPRLQRLGYTGSYVKRSGDKSDGCVTMWKKNKFQQLRCTGVNYCRGGLLDKDNIAIVTELQPIRSKHQAPSPDDKIVVANTHLLFNPKRGDIKLAQYMVLMAEIDKHAYIGPGTVSANSSNEDAKARYCPVILTGDFNMEPQSALYKFVISGKLAYEGLVAREISGQGEGTYGRNLQLDRNFFSPKYGITDYCQYHTAVVDRLNNYLRSSKVNSEVSSSPAFAQQCVQQAGSSAAASDMNSSAAHDLQQLDESIIQVGASYSEEKPSWPSSYSSEIPSSLTCRQPQRTQSKANQKANAQRVNHQRTADSQTMTSAQESPSTSQEDGRFPLAGFSGQLWHPLNLVSAYRHQIERLGGRVSEVTTHHNRGRCTVDYIFYTVDHKDTRTEWDKIKVKNIRDGKLKLLARYGLMSSDELSRLGGIPSAVQPSDHLCLITKFLLQ